MSNRMHSETTYYEYKRGETFRVVVAVSPSGYITFPEHQVPEGTSKETLEKLFDEAESETVSYMHKYVNRE